MRYEDMLSDPMASFTKATQFLELPQLPGWIEKPFRFSDFKEPSRQEEQKRFKERPSKTECLFRQCKSGDWRDKLRP